MAPVTEQAAVVDTGPCGECGCGQWGHRLGRKGCKRAGCGCGKYEPPKGATDPGLAEALTEPEPVDEPEPEPAPVVTDPVAAVDAQLAEPEPTCAYPNGEDQGEHDHALCEDVVAERDEARREATEAQNKAGHLRAKRDEERRRADRLDAQLRDVVQELEKVRAEKTRLAGQLAPRLADLDQALSDVAKLRHTNVELGRARAEIDRMRRDRDTAQAALRKTAEAYVHTSIAAAATVLFRYDADQCTTEGCGSRYTVPVDHQHPLTPVTVLVVRREVAGA